MMELIDISSALTSVFVFLVTGILGWLIHKIAKVAKNIEETERAKESQRDRDSEAMKNGIRSLLRNELVKTHRRCVIEHGYCTLTEKEIAERNYNAYHELGGNGTGTALYKAIMDLPIKED